MKVISLVARFRDLPRAVGKRWRLLVIPAALLLVLGGVWTFEQVTGTDISVRYGGTIWIPVSEKTPWLPRAIRIALHRPPVSGSPGRMEWRQIRPGFEVAELPVIADRIEVDRILLTRVDPARYRFVVRNDPTGSKHLDDWMRDLGALLVINGSYYSRTGAPATPVVIDGALRGPGRYDANQGAFVSSPDQTGLRDLAKEDWRAALRGSQTAMVSYPLLIAADGSSRAPAGTGWLANRSFLGEDRLGRIILGTTKGGFFSLDRLSDFLRRSPLDLKLALDLDGGPVACQGIAYAGFKRRSCGAWELQVDRNGHAKVLPSWHWLQPSMPMALAVYPRTDTGAHQ